MLHVCFAAGLQVAELLTLPLTVLTWQPTPTLQIQGKGRRHRALPLGQHTAEDVRAWLAVSVWLGHADRQATEVSVRADPTEQLDAIEAVSPPELRRGQFTVLDRLIAMLRDQ
jgi:site-specific recombinase XerC